MMNRLICFSTSSYVPWFDYNRYEPSVMYILSLLIKNFFVNDRFNILNDYAEWNILSRNDDIDFLRNSESLSFEECCLRRTNEIINNVSDSNIYIMASGGVDSTCVITSFMMNDMLNKENFYVLYNRTTIDEYPDLIPFLIKNGIKCIDTNMSYEILSSYSTNGYMVSGFCGDCICPPYYDNIFHNKDWKDVLSIMDIKYVDRRLQTFNSFDLWISQIEDYFKKLDFNIVSFREFFKCMLYCLHYTNNLDQSTLAFDNPSSHIAFYDTVPFNTYFLKRYRDTQITHYDKFGYKQDFKKLIYKVMKDESYFLIKDKGHSYMQNYYQPLGFYWVDNIGRHKILFSEDNINSEIVYNNFINYIKPEYRKYFSLIPRGYQRWKSYRQNGFVKD